MEQEIVQKICAVGVVLHSLYHTIATKGELSRMAKLSMYR